MIPVALVTGGAGFIGSHLCDHLLSDGWEVRVLDDFSTGSPGNLTGNVDVVEGNVCDVECCKRVCAGVNVVFHLAARVSIRHSVQTFCEDAQTNLLGTLNILRAAGEGGVKRLIFTSSMAVYSDSSDKKTVSEMQNTEPLSPYGISKLTAEKYLCMMGPHLGVETVSLRLFNTCGSRQGYTPYVGVATIFITQALQGRPCTIFGDGEQCRDFVHVSDVVRALCLAATAKNVAGEILNVGSGIGVSVNQLAAHIRRSLGRGEFIYGSADPSELRYSVADIGKARELLGYVPKIRVQDQLKEMIDYIAANMRAEDTINRLGDSKENSVSQEIREKAS